MDGPSDRSRRKKSSRSRSDSGSPTKRKSKSKGKKQPTSAEDALEAKMRAKSRREKSSSKAADELLEAKIRKKERAAAAREESRRRPAEREEEKVEEVASDYDDLDEESSYDFDYNPRATSRTRKKVVASGAPVTSSSTTSEAGDGIPKDADGNALFTRGGGDVRNRPPPSQQQQVLDPLRAAELERQKNKKDVNQRFADLHETGQWGGLTKWEKFGICLITLGAIVTAIVLGVRFGRGGPETPSPTQYPTKAPTQSPSASPTIAPTDATYRETYGLELMTAASPKLTLPQTPGELQGAKDNEDSTPQELAAEFVLYDDPTELPARDPRFMERYALVVFYYANGGCAGDWVSRTNWMNNDNHCGWHGVVCDLKKRVIELNLSRNYITGKIPVEFSQLLELSTMDLSNNAIVGTVPAEALSMRKMYTIQLNNNMLTGEFPFEDVKKGAFILDNLWIQENEELSGSITEAYCILYSITLDCDNFDPQPTYPPAYGNEGDEGKTQFQLDCEEEVGRSPNEYTCNFDPPEPFVKELSVEPALPAEPAVCGTPAVGT